MKTKIIKLKSGEYARILIRTRHSTLSEARWVSAMPKILSSLKHREVFRSKKRSGDLSDQWDIKLQTLAKSWNKRTAVGSRGCIQPKTAKDWNQSCRTMLSQFYNRIARLSTNGKWGYWATNKASNHRKRMREKLKGN